MNTRTQLPLMTLAVAVTAAALPPTLAQAACVTYLAASAPIANDDCIDAYGCSANQQAGGLPTISKGLNRVKPQALGDADGSVSALSAPPQSSGNIACLSDAYGAPIVAEGLTHARDHLRQVLNRLEQQRVPGRSQPAGLSIYALGGAQSSRQDADAGTAASTLRVSRLDLTVGGDYRLNNDWVAGASVGVGNPRMRWRDNPVRVDGSSTNLTAYGSWSPTAASYVSAALSTERSRYALRSDDGVTSTRDDAKASHVGFSLSAGYDFTSGNLTVSPYARADQISSRVGSFGSTSSENKGRTGSVSAGSQLQFNVPTQWGLLAPHARLEFTRITQWKLSGDSSATYAASAGVLPSPNPLALDRQFGQFGAGVSALFQRGTTVFADYDTGFAQKGVDSWRFTLGLRTEL
jgi:outer membrane autotransporter protein